MQAAALTAAIDIRGATLPPRWQPSPATGKDGFASGRQMEACNWCGAQPRAHGKLTEQPAYTRMASAVAGAQRVERRAVSRSTCICPAPAESASGTRARPKAWQASLRAPSSVGRAPVKGLILEMAVENAAGWVSGLASVLLPLGG